MPKRTAATITAAALILLTLTGCAGTPEEAPSEAQSAPQSAPAETAEPLVAETPADTDRGDAEAAYLKFLADHPRQGTIIPNATDEQRLAAGYEICERLAAGEEGDDISVIEGEERNEYGAYVDSYDMYSAAVTTGLCD